MYTNTHPHSNAHIDIFNRFYHGFKMMIMITIAIITYNNTNISYDDYYKRTLSFNGS